jgi:hypothetical protein
MERKLNTLATMWVTINKESVSVVQMVLKLNSSLTVQVYIAEGDEEHGGGIV